MTETLYTQGQIAHISTRLDNIERMVSLDIAANQDVQALIARKLKTRKNSAKVYLAMRGEPKSQEELMRLTRLSQSTVSKIISHLFDSALIHRLPAPDDESRLRYAWNELEKLHKVSKIAKEIVGE
jgi:DNA-binding MarR family transcriptional regulator